MKFKALALIVITLVISLLPAIAQAAQTPSGIPFSEVEGFIDDYMEKYIGKSTPGAAVVLVKDGELVFSKGYGYADAENQVAVSADTVFEYGSVSKLFVYTTIMRLAEQGKIDLNADIREYLPEGFLKKLNYDKPITMLNIMNHTAGFEDFLFDVILTSPDNLPTLEEVLRNSQPEQVYEPGTVSAYSNYAVTLAAYIAEGMLGQEYYEYLMETVFLPLGMDDTTAHVTLADHPGLLARKAKVYLPGKDSFQPGPWSYVVLYPVGAVTGTAEDLARYAIALMPEEGQESPLFAHRETLKEMLSQTHAMGPGMTGFAHGFIEWTGAEFYSLGHGGNTASSSAQFNIVPDERFGVIILTNAAGEMDITSGLTDALIGKRKPAAPAAGSNLPDAREVEGTYVSARRMHNGFLEMYGYFTKLEVKALDANTIELNAMGQKSTLVQTSPFMFERLESQGPIFSYHFSPVYFDVQDGKVLRMSGDYLPVPAGRTAPWLFVSLGIAAVSALFFILAPVGMGIGWLRRRRHPVNLSPETSRFRKLVRLMTLTGTALLVNNAALIFRMLIINNYRSFAELRIHILLNYPLVAAGAVFFVLAALSWRGAHLSKGQKVFAVTNAVVLVAFATLLINWQFLTIIG